MHFLQEQFRQFIKQHNLADREHPTLLAVSGGIDSVVMADLFAEAGLPFAIAHCNFSLRGEESEGDEKFVKSLAEKYQVPFHNKRFDTAEYALVNNISIQMAARELRYEWFEVIAKEHGYTSIATAHHKGDTAETIILNLTKGAVLSGLQGIPFRNKNIIRPLLFAAREDIKAYACDMKISYREDSSNTQDKYQRNLIRNRIIPLLREINPAVVETLSESAAIREELYEWLSAELNNRFKNIFNQEGRNPSASTDELKTLNPAVLFEMLKDYSFSYTQLTNLFDSLNSTEAKIFESPTHRLVKERDKVVLSAVSKAHETEKQIDKGEIEFTFGGLIFSLRPVELNERLDFSDTSKAYLNADKLKFPLTLRTWQSGDSFIPYGMKGKKKLSDFLTDLKLSYIEKEQQLVLLSGEDIVWVVGKRIDERYKVNTGAGNVLMIEIKRS